MHVDAVQNATEDHAGFIPLSKHENPSWETVFPIVEE